MSGDPAHPETPLGEWIPRGLNALAQGRLDDALAAFREMLSLDPASDVAWMGVSMVHERRGDVDQAIEAIRRALELEPGEPLYYANLSRFYQRKGMIAEAEEAMATSHRLQRG